MKLYHGTSERLAKKILKSGPKPRESTGNGGHWKHTVDSREDAVYLTDIYGLFFAGHAARTKKDGRAVIFEIDIDKLYESRLVPDEDFLEQATRSQPIEGLIDDNMESRTIYFRMFSHLPHLQQYWLKSLEGLGTICHLGEIPREAITRMVYLDLRKRTELWIMSGDPTISLMNHLICKQKYSALTNWIFGEVVNPYDILMITKKQVDTYPEFYFGAVKSTEEMLDDHTGIEIVDLT